MLINADFTQVPDVRQIIRAGTYGFRIDKVEDKPPQKPETKGMNVVLDLTLVAPENATDYGRQMTYYCFIPSDSRRPDAYTNIKRVFMSAGLPIEKTGLNTAHLVGRTIVALVTNGTRKDEQSGMIKESYQISEVLIPSDPVKLGESNQVNVPGAAVPSQVLGGVPGMAQPPVPQQAPQAPVDIHPSMMPQAQQPQQPAYPPQAPPQFAVPGAPVAPMSIPPQVQAPVPQAPPPAFPGLGLPQQ